ncbi:hypothetical protein N7539_001269 [Penicillium diatomitis]|nr:hypothetical protein N7539_006550 [Penicillium diatomitis]KAJ5492523.1 hypothetical protein N7539_001269 [Penicillium diatomitis]
MLTVSSF